MSRLRALTSFFPVLALLFALAGIAGARAGAERFGSPSAFALCMAGAQTSGELPDGGHDCLNCCLSSGISTLAPSEMPTLWSSVVAVLQGPGADFALNGFGLPAPLSRGPPASSFA